MADIASGRFQTIDQLLVQLKKVVDSLHPLLQYERIAFNMIESQHSQLRGINDDLVAKNTEAEANIAKSVQTAKEIVKQGEDEMKRLKASAGELYAKAYERYQQLEAYFGEAEKRSVNQHLKKLETASKVEVAT